LAPPVDRFTIAGDNRNRRGKARSMTAVHGTSVDIPTPDGTADAYLVHPDDEAAHPAVLLYMDAFGLRPRLREMAGTLAGAGYTVLVPNVMYRRGRRRR
jgi:carboxymethylenebutenolidase